MNRFVWLFLLLTKITIFGVEGDLHRYGTKYGGFYYPNNLKLSGSESIVYCIGAGEDITHDVELAKKIGSKVYIFDPTPRAITHVALVKDVLDGVKEPVDSPRYGGGDSKYWGKILAYEIASENLVFSPVGLYTEDTEVEFYYPDCKEYVSCTVLKGQKGKECLKVAVKKLSTIMAELGHDKIDLLKIDIEGIECEVIDQMLDEAIFPTYLAVDFDLGWNVRNINRKRCLETIDRITSFGYVLLHSEGSDYSFKYMGS
jgi:hypothetical protein